MLQHVMVGERVAEMLRKLFTMIVPIIFVQNLCGERHFYISTTLLLLTQLYNIICNAFLKDNAFLLVQMTRF